MKGRICLCPASIAWIRKHLMKSARRKFSTMISGLGERGAPSLATFRRKKKRFSRKQLAAQKLFAKRARDVAACSADKFVAMPSSSIVLVNPSMFSVAMPN